MRRTLILMLFFCLGGITLYAETTGNAKNGSLTIQPEVMNIGTFFSGGEITISGEVPGGQDIFVEIIGPVAKIQFDIKGRFGPFWMTRGKAELEGTPSMYVLLLPGEENNWQSAVSSLGLGLDNLRDKISIRSETMPPDDIFNMFIDLKKSEGLYIEKDNSVTYASSENGYRKFTAEYRFPSSTTAGEYTIKATALEQGVKRSELSSQFSIEEVGFIGMVKDLATTRRLIYGILAVLIALFAGAVMGVLFKGGGGH